MNETKLYSTIRGETYTSLINKYNQYKINIFDGIKASSEEKYRLNSPDDV
jgi:hypothetical protein